VYSIVLTAAMMSGGHSADLLVHGWHAGDGFSGWGYEGFYGSSYGYGNGCCGCGGWVACGGCCGAVTPWLLPGPTVTRAEQKKWDDYVASLDSEDDKREVSDLWERATVDARRQLLEKIPAPYGEKKGEKEVEKKVEKKVKGPGKPLSAAEQKKWDDYVKTLKGEKKDEAEESWKKAGPAEKRRLLREIPEKE
jgi:hypothetical protein